MRRQEFKCDDPKIMDEILNTCDYGVLALSQNDVPYSVPLNFAWSQDTLYAHGSLEGKKVDMFKNNAYASFSIVQPLSFIPSYFSNTRAACPATQLFVSLHIQGTISIVETSDEKVHALNVLMEKMQPEGQYDIISADNPIYKKMVHSVGVYKLLPTTKSLKVKVGQNLSNDKLLLLMKHLEERNTDMDKLTLKIIKAVLFKDTEQ